MLGNILKDGYNSPVKSGGAGTGFDRTSPQEEAPPRRLAKVSGLGKHRKGYRDHSIIGRRPHAATHARRHRGGQTPMWKDASIMAEQTKLRAAGEKAISLVRAIGQDATLCMRSTSDKSTCQACMDICPGHAIRLPKSSETKGGVKLTVSKGFCVDCGLCATVCPTSSMIVLEPTPRHLRHLLKRAQKAAGGSGRHVYLTCIETGLAKESPSVVEVPCLGALTKETWASLMLDFPNLAVYLPGDLCPRCKAKAAEEIIVNAVVDAQEIVGAEMPLVEMRRELDFTDSKGNIPKDGDDMFSDIGSGFGDIARDLINGEGEDLTEEERGNKDMKQSRIRVRKEITPAEGEETPGLKGGDGLSGTLTVPRATILDAVMRFPQIAPRVTFRHVTVDASKLKADETAAQVALENGDVEAATAAAKADPRDALVEICPLGALHKTEDGGIRCEPLVCTMCGLCKEAFPEAVEPATTCAADLLLKQVEPEEPAAEE